MSPQHKIVYKHAVSDCVSTKLQLPQTHLPVSVLTIARSQSEGKGNQDEGRWQEDRSLRQKEEEAMSHTDYKRKKLSQELKHSMLDNVQDAFKKSGRYE